MISQGQNQLLPDSTRANRKPRTLRYDISSLDRNFATEQSNKFRWRLPNAIREVSELSIVAGSIPKPALNIWGQITQTDDFNYNKFTVLLGGIHYTVTIVPGYYDSASAFATAIENALNVAIGPGTFTVAASPTEILTITNNGNNSFTFLLGTGGFVDQIDQRTKAVIKVNSPSLLMGFLPGTNYVSDPTGVLVAPNAADIFLLVNRIYVYINYDSTQDLVCFDRGTGRRQPTGIIYLDNVSSHDRVYLNKDTYQPIIKFRPAPIARIAAFDIRFEDIFGRPINFLGRELSLVIECVSLEP
jgi:hypothetical protein